MAEGSQSVGGGQIATQPFADIGEIPFPYDPTPTRDIYREFLPTDARTVMIVCHPQHYNFIINPSLRVDAAGWEINDTEYVLNQAVWAIAASNVRGDSLALDDLSEGGTADAVFGAGAAAPRILAHTGEDYLYVPSNAAAQGISINMTIPNGSTSVFRVFPHATNTGSIYLLEQAGTGAVRFFLSSANKLTVEHYTGSAWVTVIFAANIPLGEWHDIVITLAADGTSVTALIDGVEETKTFGSARSSAVTTVTNCFLVVATTAGISATICAVADDAYIMDISQHHTGFTKIRNSGSAGGDWTVNRAATGFKTVVVDRPLLLFGGAQKMEATVSSTLTEATIMIMTRQFGTPGDWTWYDSTSTGAGRSMGYHANAQQRVWNSHWNGNVASVSNGVVIGASVLGSRYTGTSIQSYANGVFSAPVTGTAAPWGRDNTIRIGQDSANANGLEAAFVAAAVFDRALTDAEMDRVAQEMTAGAIPKHGITLDPQSWVGQSVLLDGQGTVRIRDTDSDSNLAYVYVGPSQDINQLDWYEPGRASAEWTFSAYFLGGKAKPMLDGTVKPARARLVMHAYYPTEQGVYKSPPQYVGITVVADPATAPYGEASVADNDGQVWTRREGPYYAYLDKPPISAVDPLTIMSTGPQPPVGKMPYLMYNNRLYGLKDPYPETAGITLYNNLADPTEKADPASELPGATYLITSGSGDANYDGQVWMLIDQPLYEPTGQEAWFDSVDGPWVELRDDGEWQRLHVQTDAFSREEEGRVSFLNGYWIDCIVQYENVDGVRLSSLMLDPCESPIAAYFDGAMTPEPNVDDFLWSKVDVDQAPLENQCISYYYYDQRGRMKWLWDNLRFLVPIGRPYQIFFGAFDRPYIPKSGYLGASPEVRELTI